MKIKFSQPNDKKTEDEKENGKKKMEKQGEKTKKINQTHFLMLAWVFKW